MPHMGALGMATKFPRLIFKCPVVMLSQPAVAWYLLIHAHTHQITMAVLKQVTDKICDEMQSLEEGEETDQIRQHFENTQQHMQHVKESDRG